MPSKKSTRTQLCITDIGEDDDTLQAAASIAKRTTRRVIPDAGIDDEDDVDHYDDLGEQRNENCLMNNDSGNLHSQIIDKDCLDVATQNRLMLEMLLENQGQWKTELRHEWVRMAAKGERMAAKRDQWAAEHAELTQ
jgi:hypothetical protein